MKKEKLCSLRFTIGRIRLYLGKPYTQYAYVREEVPLAKEYKEELEGPPPGEEMC